MERYLVTGAGGFIGHHMVGFLKNMGHFVRGVDIKKPEFSASKADEFLVLDLRDQNNCLLATQGIDKVFNFAANMGGMGFIANVKGEVLRDNALINIKMAEACRLNKIKRIFFSSSACVYPIYKQEKTEIEPLKEHHAYPADPDNEYGWEKLFAERVYTSYKTDFGLDIRIARYHNIFGPEGAYDGGREKAPAAIARKVALAKDGDHIEVWGDGKQTRSFCYIDDCLEGSYKLMESDYHQPLNIGSDRLVTVSDMVDMIARIAKKTINKKHDLTKPQGVRGRNSDNTLCRQILNWEPKISLEDGLEKTYHWVHGELIKTGRIQQT
ncbi:NAD-dependent epimerase/dehydratase family protein [Candidatus Uhrbacteria bacterium]|nr:NAD-dependent epimerase/dehydratase family protein [Candidatus Uhrbacteria bacterium]